MAVRYHVSLPKTKFPLRVNAITHEPTIQRAAKFNELYNWQRERNSNKTFTLHDGPPYANGKPHMGHVLNKVLKDIVNRYKLMRGYQLYYRPGWDCHGLPIELKACKDADFTESSPLKIRTKAAKFAEKTLKVQREAFKRWGCIGDWDAPYKTLDPEYEANQINVFYQMYKKGCIYRGFKPVYWSPSSCTALAEAELEYQDHTSQATYVLFPVSSLSGVETGGNAYALVWTTTPWTLIANRAICYNPDHQYSLVQVQEDSRLLLVGSECLSRLSSIVGKHRVNATFTGAELHNAKYTHPLDGTRRNMPFLPGSHVTASEGTGLVHTAPTHGLEDHAIGVQYGLDLQCYVNEHGKYTSEAGPELENLFVLSDGNRAIISKLRSQELLFHEEAYSHRYPYDWRTKKPVIIRSTEQWFASVTALKEEAKDALYQVEMYPPSSVNRMLAMLETRSDWCISRQRVWGVPLPIFYHKESGEALVSEETIAHVEGLIRKCGSDCWWRLSTSELLPTSLQDQADAYVKGSDTMDVWFDSGSSWATVLEENVADMYLEGSDQHRGWFQSSLLTSTAAQGKAPYRSVVTHGFVLDGKGQKMSKSLGNVISPQDVIDSKKYGADVMRLWVAASNFTSDVSVSDSILQQINDELQKIRGTCRFMLGNLADFNPATDLLPYPQLSRLDRYTLHVLHRYCSEATQAYESLAFSRLCHQLVSLVRTDLSSFYFDIIKDRLYCDAPAGEVRRSTQTALHHLLQCFSRSIAPITPHLAEEIAQHYPFEEGSVFKAGWMEHPEEWSQPLLAADFEALCSVKDVVNKALDLARTDKAIRSSLEAKVFITTDSGRLNSLLHNYAQFDEKPNEFHLDDILLVSGVTLDTEEHLGFQNEGEVTYGGESRQVRVSVRPAMERGRHKCPRCWKYTASEGLCVRCTRVVKQELA